MKKQILRFTLYAVIVYLANFTFNINRGIAQIDPSIESIETVFNNRSIAMGKTTITTPRGSSAIFSNPSILAAFTTPQVQVGGKLLFGTIEDEGASEYYDSYKAKIEPYPNRSWLAFATPYELPDPQLSLAFGVGYQRHEGVKEKYDRVNDGVTSTITDIGRGYLSTITPGVALNYQNRYFLGVTFNRTLGAITTTGETKRSDYHLEVNREIKQSAQFFRLGAFAQVTPDLYMGMMFRPEFEWEFGDTIVKRYEDGELETDRSSERIELTIPTMFGIGAVYKVSPELTVALEAQSRPFSELQWRGDIEVPFIDDGFNFSVGAEYLGHSYPVRFGAFRDVIPYADENDTTPVNLVGVTGGVGYAINKSSSWDASAIYSKWERANDEGQKYSKTLIRVSISATYRFN